MRLNRSSIRAVSLWLALVAALLLPCMAGGDSGLALAYPVEGIRIDGDFSDWPAVLPRYPIALPLIGSPRDARDCSAEFRVGYNETETALYVAIGVQDADEAEPRDGSLLFSEIDGAIVIVAIPREGPDPLILGFLLRRDNVARTVTESGPGNARYETTNAIPSCFEAKAETSGDRHSYEYRIDFEEMSRKQFRLRPNGKLELGLWVW